MRTFRRLITFFCVVVLGYTANAQTELNKAIEVYNKGVTALSANNVEEAIALFKESETICNQLGVVADSQKLKVQSIFPKLYYKLALNYTKTSGNLYKTVNALDESMKTALVCKDQDTYAKAKSLKLSSYGVAGLNAMKASKFDSAIIFYKNALEIDSNYAKGYLYLGTAYLKLKDNENMLVNVKKVLYKTTDTVDLAKAKSMCRVYYVSKAKNSLGAKKYALALPDFITALTYDNKDPEIYGFIAQCNNNLKKYDDAMVAAKQAEALTPTDPSIVSNINYEIGIAYKGKGDNANACAYLAKVTAGKYVESAKFERTQTLKCK